MPVIKRQTPEQEAALEKYNAIVAIALEAGFTEEMLEDTDACLMPFFNAVIEKCAQYVEQQKWGSHTQEQMSTYKHAAEAVRCFGKNVGEE